MQLGYEFRLMKKIVGGNEPGSETPRKGLRVLKKKKKKKVAENEIYATKHFSHFTLNSLIPFFKRREEIF